MDPEPGRCRRTDGKKWRCARSVIPDQKYCDRHMHRGRLHSRKHVEVYEKISESKPDTGDKCHPIPVGGVDNKISKSMSGIDTTYAKTTSTSNSSIQVPAKPQLVNPSLDTGNSVSFTEKSIVTSSSNGKSLANVHSRKDSSTGPIAFNPYNGNKKILKINGPVAPTFNFSPKSVLQHSKSNCGFGSSSIDNVTAVMDDSPRCRRTDGKKWRCKREVLHKQKYCAQHMHRGSKRLATALHSMVTLAKSPPPPLATSKSVDTGAGSVSLAAKSPQQIGENEYISITGSSSSSDATTVTDENTSDSRLLNLSP